MNIFFAGSDASPKYNVMLKANGVTNRLESYFALSKTEPSAKDFDRYLLDSGGYSARVRGITISVAEYAAYINKFKIKYAFNLDTNSVPETLANQKYLEENTKAYIIPIYHLSDWLDPKYRSLLERYIEKYPYIGLGGSAGVSINNDMRKKFLDFCFSHTKAKTKVHGLGMTSNWMLERYPYYSVDSTSWQQIARFGGSKVHSNDMAKVKARKRHYMENLPPEVQYWVNLEESMTRLWKNRGVVWEEIKKQNED